MSIQPIRETRDHVVSTIRQVATAQNVDFRYLLNQAQVESGLDPRAKAATSSATGLFQFTAGTWFDMVKRHGDKIGLAGEAQALRDNTASAVARAQILDLRNEPQTSAALAARYAVDNGRALVAAGHRSVGPTELYLAHFLGPAGASTFLNGMRENPLGPAAHALPNAANANSGIFFRGGAPRSYQDIYNRFADKFRDAARPQEASQLADLGAYPPIDKFETFDSKLKEIVSSALSTQANHPSAELSAGSSELAVSEEVMVKYLKNFSLADHTTGMAQLSDFRSRDASKAASSNGSNPSTDEGSVSSLASGARMLLRAAGQELKNDGFKNAIL